MSNDITGLCLDHSFESAAAICRRCAREFCDTCVVYPFGPKKPYCKECAMAIGGVRTHVSRPAQPPKLVRKRIKAFEAFIAAAQSGEAAAAELNAIAALNAVINAPTATDLLDELPGAPIPSPTAPSEDKPAEGLAPPIDWDQPFG
jgi:hypothetical protein